MSKQWRVVGGSVVDSRDNVVADRHSRKHLSKDPRREKGDYISPVEADANTHLMAAAPEMLEVCRIVEAMTCSVDDDCLLKAKAAIIKATGG